MKNIIMLMLIALPLVGCSAYIGPAPTTKQTTTYVTPVKVAGKTVTKTTTTETTY